MREFLQNGPADSKKTRTQMTPQCVNAILRSSPKTDTAVEKEPVPTVQKSNTDLCDSLKNTKVEIEANETNGGCDSQILNISSILDNQLLFFSTVLQVDL